MAVEKWTAIVEWYKNNDTVIVDGGKITCGLCLFYEEGGHCGLCPLQEIAGSCLSQGSVYADYASAVLRGDTEGAKQAAEEMLEALQRLQGQREE